ncbi:cytochrome P450 [Tumebacillus sp. ITR2]|uniref:Cytochrome P450 n=1 Tax=Tumebacillus amylolyticus TaxID=2801339 RepID=A0ABS1J6V0_9BACL|nr:cytochrome P450 [Tumebacillus amylolyticus]MBL0385989.1 cytochrome P450 [Tumebacillus amylolyticus]
MESKQVAQTRGASFIPPLEEFNTEEKRANPFPILKTLRENTPLRFDETYGTWDAFLYEDCVRILKDPKTFSSNFNRDNTNTENIITVDPPRHQDFRELVNGVFTPKAVADVAPRIYEILNFLLDAVQEQGRMNTVYDVAAPLPVMVIAELLGIPTTDRLYFKELSDTLVTGVTDSSEETYKRVQAQRLHARDTLNDYFRQHLQMRKEQPTEDLISVLWYANAEKQVLDEDQILRFLTTLLVAGHETTTNLITAMVRVLSEQPQFQERLLEEPHLIPGFVEETLRFYPSVPRLTRRATMDVELRGQVIREGQLVNVWMASANRDGAKFAHPDVFDPTRHPNAHITFGFGNHFCLGAPLARLEAQIALETILRRLGNIALVEGTKIEPTPYPLFTAVKEYPVTFEGRSI